MMNIPEYFGSMVFDDSTMKERLPSDIYNSLKRTIDEGSRLEKNVADAVANAMKDWAVEKGATHYTHWFQPMTGITAEKHDSFISPSGDGKVIMEFSGKELIKGEPDASSFPSGGLRTTFEARGYTAWDPTSYAFLKNNTLYIPTAFCAYGGLALDQKTPLLRSMEAINKQTLRILRLFGSDATHVQTCVGAEQEYFLIDKDMFDKRKDLVYSGRTLFGSRPPKGQEMDDHYFGAIKPKVAEFMADLNHELWTLGVLSKTEHNEVAPAQHELAPIYSTTNIATDHNQLTMELMQQVARRHGMVCLLHEKPFEGVNGSGKHNNWSLSTNTGVNLLSPGDTPHENAQFLLFICAVIQAVDDYQDLLRLSVATAGNDHRLGAHEAPPAVVSIFLGDELTDILKSIESDTAYSPAEKTNLKLGVHVLPRIPKDNTDRNRTSPFAFTGNKFEFRMLGSANSIASPNIMINTAVAESLRQYADILEQAEDFNAALHDLIKDVVRKHKRIIFNGNGYDDAWIKEATEKRGLLNLPSTPDALPHLLSEKNLRLFETHKVFSEAEARSRYEILMDNYCKVIHIEAMTMIDMVRKEILPAVCAYQRDIAETAAAKRRISDKLDCGYEIGLIDRLSKLTSEISEKTDAMEDITLWLKQITDITQLGIAYKDMLIPKMRELRKACDEAENHTAESYWPFPTYGELLFGVR